MVTTNSVLANTDDSAHDIERFRIHGCQRLPQIGNSSSELVSLCANAELVCADSNATATNSSVALERNDLDAAFVYL